jgi:hypothetical protein
MSKKSKRQVRRPITTAPAGSAEFKPDYSDIKKDLKRIGLLAGTFFIVLIGLSFFLR